MAGSGTQSSERRPLLLPEDDPSTSTSDPDTGVGHRADGRRIRLRLYTSHFLSTWNSRVFEFGSVLYLAKIFPDTLMPLSVYAIARAVAALVLSPAVGRYIDRTDRLTCVRVSIVLQRITVAVSCALFYLLVLDNAGLSQADKLKFLGLLALLACGEKLGSVMNLVSVEKDWVVVIAGSDHDVLSTMNAQMRRIDLVCKLVGPFFIALVDDWSTRAAIIVNFAMNGASVGIEYFAIARAYREEPKLQAPKTPSEERREVDEGPFLARTLRGLKRGTSQTVVDFGFYFRHRAALASFAGAWLYLTVLSFSGRMVTYLLASGFSSTTVAIARTTSVAFEVSATFVAPRLMSVIGPVRTGLWFLCFQTACLGAGVAVFIRLEHVSPLASAWSLVTGSILSRLGLWGFDLCAQVIVQEEVEASDRGKFSSVEAAWQNAFELMSYVSTIVFARPDQFKWPSVISLAGVATATVLFAVFVRVRRGHLVHLDKLGCGFCKVEAKVQAEEGL